MRSKRTGNKIRHPRRSARKLENGAVGIHVRNAALGLNLIEEDGENREDDWLGELCAPKSLPLPIRRKRL
jgi:hypothetical protein